METISKRRTILKIIIYAFLALFPLEIAESLAVNPEDPSGQPYDQFEAILSDSEIKSKKACHAKATLACEDPFALAELNPPDIRQALSYLKYSDLDSDFQFFICKYHPCQYTSSS